MSGLADDEVQDAQPDGEPDAQDDRTEDGDEPASGATLDDLMQTIRQINVGDLLLSTASTLASVAYGKLETRDLGEAKTAIDAIRALIPVLEGQVEEGMRRDFEQALTNLQLAYADAVASAE